MALVFSLLAASIGAAGARPAPELVDFFSFEEDFQGWVPNGVDVQVAPGITIPWSITRSQDMAKDGVWSVKLFLVNENDEGMILIQRPFLLQPNQTYQVQVSYYMAPFPNPVAPLTNIAGVLTRAPATSDDLVPFFQRGTQFFRKFGARKFTRYDYEFTARADEAGSLYVFIGFWAQFEVDYTYYVDAVLTTFTMRQPGASEPVINSVELNGRKNVRINGSAFGPSSRVIVDNIDRSDFITGSSDNLIRLKGGSLSEIVRVHSVIRVVDDTTAAASEPFVVPSTN